MISTDALQNSGESQLFVKLIPATPNSNAFETIFIRDIDDDGKFTGEYIKYKVANKEDLRDIYRDGRGHIELSEPSTAILSFDEIKDGRKYKVYK